MRIEEVIAALKVAQREAEENVFKAPPQNYEDFKKLQGFWMGLSESLRLITEIRNKDHED